MHHELAAAAANLCADCMCEQMDAAQQYNTNGRGYSPLLDWATQHTQQLQAPPAGQEVVITSGSNHAIDVRFPTLPPCLAETAHGAHLSHNRCLLLDSNQALPCNTAYCARTSSSRCTLLATNIYEDALCEHILLAMHARELSCHRLHCPCRIGLDLCIMTSAALCCLLLALDPCNDMPRLSPTLYAALHLLLLLGLGQPMSLPLLFSILFLAHHVGTCWHMCICC